MVDDDRARFGYSRKLAFLKFLPMYTSDPVQLLELGKEIEMYILEYTSSTFKAFVNILDGRINEQVQRLGGKRNAF